MSENPDKYDRVISFIEKNFASHRTFNDGFDDNESWAVNQVHLAMDGAWDTNDWYSKGFCLAVPVGGRSPSKILLAIDP